MSPAAAGMRDFRQQAKVPGANSSSALRNETGSPDPDDPNMPDVVGFDVVAPEVIRRFVDSELA